MVMDAEAVSDMKIKIICLIYKTQKGFKKISRTALKV